MQREFDLQTALEKKNVPRLTATKIFKSLLSIAINGQEMTSFNMEEYAINWVKFGFHGFNGESTGK